MSPIFFFEILKMFPIINNVMINDLIFQVIMKKCLDTKYFVFETSSAKQQRSCDCVVRSISLAENKTWKKVYTDLCELGLKMYRMPNEKEVFEKYLKQNGWLKQKMPKYPNNTRYTGKEFCSEYGGLGTAIVSMRGHLAVMIDSKFHDIWDCSDCCVGNYWIKNK